MVRLEMELNEVLKYEKMLKSNDGMPRWNSFFNPVLTVIEGKDTWTIKELKKEVIETIGLPTSLKSRRYDDPRYRHIDTIAESRVGFAISLLKNAGLVSSPKRGFVKSSDAGIEYLNKYRENITENQIKLLPKYREYKRVVEARKQSKLGSEDEDMNYEYPELESSAQSERRIGNLVEQLNGNVVTILLDRILAKEPVFFERMTVDLLVAMGYKGLHGKSLITQLVGDRGIDGVISEDPLGTKTIYLQAKRYMLDSPVHRPDIQKFYGALAEQGNEKGVFITTSKFTKNAQESADKFGNIITIDGSQLTNLMLEYKVGVNVKKKFEIFDIDEDYFIDE
jgi:restriction system protein